MRKESATLCVTGGKIVRHSYGLGSYYFFQKSVKLCDSLRSWMYRNS